MTREQLLFLFKEPIPVLDHGYVKLVDCMGTDDRIDSAARTSYGGEEF
jgi:thymidylate synthase (FAD)